MTPQHTREWLAVKLYRLAGRVYGLAARIEPASAELEGDCCRFCAHQDEMQQVADESYQAGGEDAYRGCGGSAHDTPAHT